MGQKQDKKVTNILLDNHYMILEFEDGTFIPARLLDDIFHSSETYKCQFCGNTSNLVSLNNKQYICQECVRKLFQMLIDNGASMNLQLDKFLNRQNS